MPIFGIGARRGPTLRLHRPYNERVESGESGPLSLWSDRFEALPQVCNYLNPSSAQGLRGPAAIRFANGPVLAQDRLGWRVEAHMGLVKCPKTGFMFSTGIHRVARPPEMVGPATRALPLGLMAMSRPGVRTPIAYCQNLARNPRQSAGVPFRDQEISSGDVDFRPRRMARGPEQTGRPEDSQESSRSSVSIAPRRRPLGRSHGTNHASCCAGAGDLLASSHGPASPRDT
jgi:hypothetical protein